MLLQRTGEHQLASMRAGTRFASPGRLRYRQDREPADCLADSCKPSFDESAGEKMEPTRDEQLKICDWHAWTFRICHFMLWCSSA
jgi:hypothetical protein